MYQYIHKETYIYIYQHIGLVFRGAVKEEGGSLSYIHTETYIHISIYT